MFSKKTLSVLAVSILASSGVFAASQQIEGRPGVPQVDVTVTNADGTTSTKKIVPQTLDQVPGKYCPAKNPTGFDKTTSGVGTSAKKGGWSCSQLHLSGNNLVSLFDKAYSDHAPGAKNLAYDYLLALTHKKIADGTPDAQAWGEMNKVSQELHGNNVVGHYQNSFGTLGYNNYDDPASALMFDNVNRCGCVTEFDLDTNMDLYLEKNPDGSTEMPSSDNVQDGCPGVTAFSCAKTLDRLNNSGDYWGGHQYNKSFKDLANSCIYWWNTLINNTYNQKYNNTTDINDPKYTQVCDTGVPFVQNPCCTVEEDIDPFKQGTELSCNDLSFVGPGIVSFSGEVKDAQGQKQKVTQLFSYKNGNVCGKTEGKIDIVAQ